MADELGTPSVSRWGYVVLDYVGLGFILVGPEEWVRIGSWKVSLAYIAIGAAFLFLGIMGAKIKGSLVARLPWVRLKSELAAALVRIEELKKNQRPSMWDVITAPTAEELKSANDRAEKYIGLYNDQNRELEETKLTLRTALGDLEKMKAKPSSPDKITLEAFKKLLSKDGGINQLRDQQFWGRFPWAADALLVSFLQQDTGPDHGFLDERLEGLRQCLHVAVKLLLDRVYRYSDPPTTPTDVAAEQFRFFWKTDGEDIAAYDARRNEVFLAAKEVCDIYDDLVLTARRTMEI